MLQRPPIRLDEQPGHLIRRAHQVSVSRFYDMLGRDVTPVQYAVLALLEEKPGIDQATLAQEVALDTSSAADIAVRLEAKGWITRRVRARGQRCLELTDAGAAVLADVAPGLERLQKTLLGPLSVSEQADLMRLLAKFVGLNGGGGGRPGNAGEATSRDRENARSGA